MHRDMYALPPSQLTRPLRPELEQIIDEDSGQGTCRPLSHRRSLGRVLMTFGQTVKPRRCNSRPDPETDAACATPPTRASLRSAAPPPDLSLSRRPPADDLEDVVDIDWISVVLGLLALASVGG